MDDLHVGLPQLLSGGFLADAAHSLAMTRILLGAWLVLVTLQWLAAATVFAEEGPLPWAAIARVRTRPWLGAVRRRMSVPLLRAILLVQLVAVTVLLSATSLPLQLACLVWLIASYGGFILLTGEYWSSGADKMGMIAMAGTLLIGIGVLRGDAGVALAGVLAAGGQLAICYMVAGVSKMFFADWRNGTELAGVMATESWGHPFAAKLMGRRWIALAATWGVILGEALFPLALLAPHDWLLAALGAMLLFHVATAVFMGLNSFPWAFAAAYPAVLLLGRVVRAALGWDG